MQLTIRFSGGKRSDFGEQDYEEVLLSSLERFRHRLKQVFLYIEDVNGPRGGIDKQCRCVLRLRRMPPVVIRDEDESMTALIHRVANRAAHALSQKADRKTKRVKQNRSAQKQLFVSVAEDHGKHVGIHFDQPLFRLVQLPVTRWVLVRYIWTNLVRTAPLE